MILEAIFWCSVALVLYAYVGYPCALLALSVVRNRPVMKGPGSPSVSFIITAHNEEARIREKLENTLRQMYPPERLEIIVASDCSTDGTDALVRAFAPRVRLVRAASRRGKEAAQQLAIAEASGEVLIFSDAATALAPDGVARIVANFSDPTVGCVSSIDRVIEPDGRASGEGLYVRYEMLLRRLESAVNSLVGLSGSFFAARRDVCRRWAADRQSDFTTLLNSIELGLRGVLDADSVGYYQGLTDEGKERQRKVRTIVRGLAVLSANRRMLNPLRYGLFAWQLFSHKVCRWLVPFAMLAAAISSALLAPTSPFYLRLFAAQALFYGVAIVGWRTHAPVLKIPAFLVVSNAAVLTAWARYLRGDRMTTWNPSERLGTLPGTSLR